MDDMLKNPDEYQLKDEEIAPEETPTPPLMPTEPKKSFLGRMLVPLVLIALILAVYQILNWYSKYKQEAAAKQALIVTQKKPIIITPPSVQPVQQPSSVDSTVVQDIQTLKDNTKSTSDQLDRIEKNVSDNQAGMGDLNKSIEGLNSSINDLSKNLNDYINSLKKPKHRPVVVKKKTVLAPKINYHVKAIVSNRAWLESDRGETITVKVGDKINDGVVEMISPDKGMVLTSSGEIIQYGSNDF